MRMMQFNRFCDDFGSVARNTMNLSIYRDNFQCACGRAHWFDDSIDVLCQGSGMKLMVFCPVDSSYLTSIKIKTFMVVKFKGFESLAGTHLETAQDESLLSAIRIAVRR